ncbi:MAG TPA: acyl-CoA dehydrogenase family protein [Candidatus Dormibacteraeota bacterium]|nr:acyl-CoA dehydrogenase family protein [Candidatus Dormibacteraeota bacterium]
MSWDFSTDPEFERQLEWMRWFMRDEVLPLEILSEELDRDTFFAHLSTLQDRTRERGLWATHLPPELGGAGMGQVRLGLMHEIEGASFWGPMVFGNNAPDTGNSEVLALFGTEEQRERWLGPLLARRIYSGFSMTEPEHAGSDPVRMSTRAVPDGEGWVLDGHKWFTTNGLIADLLIVMAVTDPDADPHRRASMFLVPADTPGVEVVRNIPTMGFERFGFGHAEIRYHGVRLPKQALVGERGKGFEIAQARLGPGRIHHCMRWLGQSRRALDIMCERALQREAFGEPLARKQTVQNFIADSVAEMSAARLMTLHAAWIMDTQGVRAARKEISMIKYFGARVLHDVIDRAIQVCGGLGFSADLPLEEMYREARSARLYDGPDEVHRQSVARLVLREHAAPEGLWPADHVPTRREEVRQRFAQLLERATENA